MSRSEYSWRRATDSEELAWSRSEWEVDRDFWEYVDTQTSWGVRPGRDEWALERDGACLARNAQGTRCSQQSLGRVPFCAFHFDRAWTRIEAFVADERMARLNRLVDWDRQLVFRNAGLDVAMLQDAKRALAKQPERVYFFAAAHAVKIGRSIHPERRVKTLGATKAPEGINIQAGSLLGTIPGGSRVEGALHDRFRGHRLVGEWFALEPIRAEIAALINEHSAEETAA